MERTQLGRDYYELGLSLGRLGTVLIGSGGGSLARALARTGCGAALAGGEVKFHDGTCAACGAWLAGYYGVPAALFVRQEGGLVERLLLNGEGKPFTPVEDHGTLPACGDERPCPRLYRGVGSVGRDGLRLGGQPGGGVPGRAGTGLRSGPRRPHPGSGAAGLSGVPHPRPRRAPVRQRPGGLYAAGGGGRLVLPPPRAGRCGGAGGLRPAASGGARLPSGAGRKNAELKRA